MKQKDWEKELDQLLDISDSPDDLDVVGVKSFISNLLSFQRTELLKEMLKECDRTENEDGRLLVEKFLEKLNIKK